MEAPEEAIQVYVPPNPLCRVRDISLSHSQCQLYATVEVGLPNTWQHRTAFALFSFFVKSPVSLFQTETHERVAQFQEGLQSPLPRWTFGIPVQQPQSIEIEMWDQAGHYQSCPLHQLRHSYQHNGQGLRIFSYQGQWLCFAKVFLNESNRWPKVHEKPQTFRTVRKIAIGRLSFEGSVASDPTLIRVCKVMPCIGLDLTGNQDLFWPWTSHEMSTENHLMILNLTDGRVESYLIDLKNGHTVKTDHVSFELPNQYESFATGFLPVPETQLYAVLVKCRPRPGRTLHYACLFVNLVSKSIEAWSSKVPWISPNEKPTSLAECNLNSFYLGTSVDNLSSSVKRIEWSDLKKHMHTESQVRLEFE